MSNNRIAIIYDSKYQRLTTFTNVENLELSFATHNEDEDSFGGMVKYVDHNEQLTEQMFDDIDEFLSNKNGE